MQGLDCSFGFRGPGARQFVARNTSVLEPNASVARRCRSSRRPTCSQADTSPLLARNASVEGMFGSGESQDGNIITLAARRLRYMKISLEQKTYEPLGEDTVTFASKCFRCFWCRELHHCWRQTLPLAEVLFWPADYELHDGNVLTVNIVPRLSSMREPARMHIFCSHEADTLTQNVMTIDTMLFVCKGDGQADLYMPTSLDYTSSTSASELLGKDKDAITCYPDATALFVGPSTCSEYHQGHWATWTSSSGSSRHRLDFVAIPCDWELSSAKSWTASEVDLLNAREDHAVAAIDVFAEKGGRAAQTSETLLRSVEGGVLCNDAVTRYWSRCRMCISSLQKRFRKRQEVLGSVFSFSQQSKRKSWISDAALAKGKV